MGKGTRNPFRLPYGVREGKFLHISEVPNGLACGCECPACGDRLVARQGAVREHHFAHAGGHDCGTAVETALHLAAKEILERRKEIVLPSVESDVRFHHYGGGVKRVKHKPEKRQRLTSVALEYRIGNIVPDVVADVENRRLLIEVRVTHGIEPEKLKRIQDLDLSTVEIDLSRAPRDLPWKDLEELVVESGTHKGWIYNAFAERECRRILDEAKARIRETTHRVLAVDRLRVDCPLPARIWQGKPCANVREDCVYCEHAVEIVDGSVICNAETAAPPTEVLRKIRYRGRW